MADTLGVQLHMINQYIWAKAHPGKSPPRQKITLYSEIAHRSERKPHITDGMSAERIKQYILGKL